MPKNTNAVKTENQTDNTLHISRVFDAPRELVFKVWTDPTHLTQWFHCDGYKNTFFNGDLRVGGQYRFGMRSVDEGFETIAKGEYREITPPSRLVYTHVWENNCKEERRDLIGMETLITIDFIDQDGKTLVNFVHSGLPDRKTVESHTGGWSSFLEVLAKHLAA